MKVAVVEIVLHRRILIVEDEQAIAEMVKLLLVRDGFQNVFSAATAAGAIELIEANGADIVLLDVMLPDGSGFELCDRLRQYGEPHIIFMTARVSDLDVLTGFAVGGDDYITKPFNPLEVIARIKARLRRMEEGRSEAGGRLQSGMPLPLHEQPTETETREIKNKKFYTYSRFTLDEAAGELIVDGRTVACPAQEFFLLLHLCKHAGIVFTKSQLYEAVWGMNGMGDDNTVMVHIRRIREKIEHDPGKPYFLLTIRGLGYKLIKE
ncbi:response regulator transcription factor [Paenibacillus sp. CAU 1782]